MRYGNIYKTFLHLRSYCVQAEQSTHALTYIKRKTIKEIEKEISRRSGVSGKYFEELPNWDSLNHMIPEKQAGLPERSMEDSYDEAYLPLEKDSILRDRFTTVIGTVRLGRLLESMDFFAVWIALKYILNPKQEPDKPIPNSIVTAHVDSISFSRNLPSIKRDIIFKGHVINVGTSSLEVFMWVEQLNDTLTYDIITKAHFIMVSRNRQATKSIPVNPLVPKNEHEMKLLNEAKQRSAVRKKSETISLLKTMPNSAEQDYIHNLFIKSTNTDDKTLSFRSLPKNSHWMSDTKMGCNYFPHPENRNFNLTLFGGYIMRTSLEISWITAMYHVKARPKLIEISNISFSKAILVGSFLLMSGQVVYTEGKHMEIMAGCHIVDIETRKRQTTNTMYFTYEASEDVPSVVPQTYQEAVLLLDGKRHFERVMGRRKNKVYL